ncbi:membrane protein [Sphaerisporangium rufum]|uniref:Membrane protein n=1 Tax=Sphaerisporangium rufum TaxID=1381558 RepID=A0A919V017_9ACTN|nr:Trp biosynthesis-associated membrane protein [Sphaerisporangium rufum]GII76902.1 membrane protein [Sphaerisporangium rufum]
MTVAGDRRRAPGGRERPACAVAAAAGAGLVLVAAGRTWATVRLSGGLGGPARPVAVGGGELAPALVPLALAALAAMVAVFAARGALRRGIGAVICLLGPAIAVAALRGATAGRAAEAAAEHSTLSAAARAASVSVVWAWPAATLAGAAALLAAGLLAAVRGGRWPGMSGRYERAAAAAPRSARPAGARSLWDALDRGDDPTAGPGDRNR